LPNTRMSDSLRTAPRPINREAVARAMRPMSQNNRMGFDERLDAMIREGNFNGMQLTGNVRQGAPDWRSDLQEKVSEQLDLGRAGRGRLNKVMNVGEVVSGVGGFGAGIADTAQASSPMERNLMGALTALSIIPGMGAVTKSVKPALKNALYRSRLGPAIEAMPKPKIDYDAPAGGDPRYLGAGVDRTEMSYLRHKPSQGVSERTQDALLAMKQNRGGIRDSLLKDIRRGEQLGGNDWYNTEELRDWFVKELGEKEGDFEWKEFMNLMGAASPGSKVDANLGNAAAIRNRMGDTSIPRGSNRTRGEIYRDSLMKVDKLDDARVIARGRKEGYGHKTQGLQELVRARQLQNKWDATPQPGGKAADSTATQNPKPKGFSQSLIGSARNIAADLHFTRYMAMASNRTDWLENSRELSDTFRKQLTKKYGDKTLKPYIKTNKAGKTTFDARKAVEEGNVDMKDYADQPGMFADMPKDNEYGAFEEYIYDLGKELNMTGPQIQANLWMGAADRTGVDPSSQGTFMELLRVRADKRAKKTGKSRSEVMKEFIRNKGLLAVPTGASAASLMNGNNNEIEYY
jgi:hypothetical protein